MSEVATDSDWEDVPAASSGASMEADWEDVDAPSNSVYHAPTNRVLETPQTLNNYETQFVIDRDVDKKKGFVGQAFVGQEPPLPPIDVPPLPEPINIKDSFAGVLVRSLARGGKIGVTDTFMRSEIKTGQELQAGKRLEDVINAPRMFPRNLIHKALRDPETPEERQAAIDVGVRMEDKAKETLAALDAEIKGSWMDTTGAETTFTKKIASGLGEATPKYGVALTASFLTKNPLPAMAFFFSEQQGASYMEAREGGESVADAGRIANQIAVPVSLLDTVGIGFVFKAAHGAGAFKRFWSGANSEAGTEGAQSVLEATVMNAEGVRDQTVLEVLENATLEAAVGGILGGGSNVAFGQRVKKNAIEGGIPEPMAEEAGSYARENYPNIMNEMAMFLEREVAPLARDDASAREFATLMQKFQDGTLEDPRGAFTPEEEDVFNKWVEVFRAGVENDQGVPAVEKIFFDKATLAGLEEDQAVGAAKLLGARADAASKALGVTPMEWYQSQSLDIEVQRTPAEAIKSYQDKLDALNTDLPDAPSPERAPREDTPEDQALRDEEIAGFEKRLNDANAGTKDVSTKKPVIQYIKALGGVRADGLIAGELRHLGINSKTAPGLFRNNDTAMRDIANIPVEEFNRALGVAAKDDGNGYVDRDWLLEALRNEQFGERMGQERPVTDESFIQALDKAGLDYRTATAEQVYEALGADADIVNAAANMGVELTPKEVRQIRGLMETNPNLDAQDAIDEFVERSAYMGDTLFQRDGDQAVLLGAEKATDKQVAEKGMEGRMKSSKAQKPMDEGMFGDGFKQQTLFQSYQRVQTLQRIYEYDLLEKLETVAGYKGEAQQAKREAFLERARSNALTEEDLALKKDVVEAAKRVGGRLFQGNFIGPQFYSAVQRNIEALNQPKGSADQWAGIIKNLTQKGVKQEEIDWLGVLDWLKEQQGSVTKEQVLDYLRANEVKVEEVVKSDDDAVKIRQSKGSDQTWQIVEISTGRVIGGGYDTEQAAVDASQDVMREAGTVGPTKFSKYTLAGGGNYRELLMTLPSKSGQRRLTGFNSPAEAARRAEETSQDYASSHYSEKNILAHIRFNERTDADGKRTMFIEEVQSDWHQAGRDKGYKQDVSLADADRYKAIDVEVMTLSKKQRELMSEETAKLNAGGDYDTIHPEYTAKIVAIEKQLNDLQREQQTLRDAMRTRLDGVPNAPFKTTWPELAFKRALIWAVENNFDSVAWTTGEQQADRYDLSKQVDRIVVPMVNEGSRSVRIDGKDGGPSFKLMVDDKGVVDSSGSGAQFSGKTLDEVIGKEMAKKVMEAKEPTEFTGEGLKVGGEGMKAFYDKMLPSMVNKLTKKMGGKVGQAQLSAPSMRDGEPISFNRNPNTGRWRIRMPDMSLRGDYATKAEADAAANALTDTVQVNSIDITPAMRESIQQGLPLFQDGARGSITFARDRTLIQLFQEANPSTLLHELGHFFLRDMAKVAAASRRPRVKQDYEIVKDWLGSKDGKLTEDQEEKFARGFEAYLREGKAPKEGLQGIFDRFKQWLTAIYKSAKDLNVEINDEVRAVFDRMLGADYAKAETAVQQREAAKLESDYAAVVVPPPSSLGSDAGDVLSSAKQLVGNIFTPISSRLGRIDPKLKAAVRKYTFETGMAEQRDRERAMPFLNAIEKMEDADYRMFDFALKNRDTKRAAELLDKYGMRKEFDAVRELLDDIYNKSVASGLDVSYLDDYFPRMVKLNKAADYLSQLRGRPDWSLIKEALAAEDPMNVFTDEEKAVFVNKWLRGHASAATYLTKPSFTKDRVIDYVEPQNNQFYLESGEALLKYISAMRLGIAQSEIFGKGETAEASIGAYVLNLVQQGAIDHTQENEVKMLMQALVNSKGPGVFVSWMKNVGYVYLMGSPISAITQIGDLAFSLAKNGYYRTGVSVVKAIAGKSILTKEDLGIDNIAQEFEDNTRASAAVRKVFQIVGLSWMDNLGKQTFIESAYMRLRTEAKKNAAGWREYMSNIFGDEVDSVRQDLLDGTLSDNVKMLLYSELSDMQPVSLAEMPVGYLRGGNLRAFYMLKTYTVKQIDIYRREIFDKLASGDAGEAKEGLAMLIRLATALMLTGMGADALKDLLLGRAMTLTETTIDNLWKLATITKYNIYQAREKGIGDTVMNMLFSFGAVVAPLKDVGGDIEKIASGKREFKDAETFQRVPLVGKFYYWWVGGGHTKEEKKQGKKNEK